MLRNVATINTTDPSACASPAGAALSESLPPLTAAAGAQTDRPVVAFVAAEWPGMAHVPGRYHPVSVPGTADLVVDGRAVTVPLYLDHGGTELPYVHGYPEWSTIEQDAAIDRAVVAAWEAHEEEERRDYLLCGGVS